MRILGITAEPQQPAHMLLWLEGGEGALTKITEGAGYSGARCHVFLQLVLPEDAAQLPPNWTLHPHKLTTTLMLVSLAKDDDLWGERRGEGGDRVCSMDKTRKCWSIGAREVGK